MGNYCLERYHGVCTEWRDSSPKGSRIGIELEVVAKAHTNYTRVLEMLPNFPSNTRPLTEEDGSLPDRRGVEIVFPPFSPSTLRKKTSTVAKAMAAIRNVVDDNHHSSGMHLNVNTTGWDDIKACLFAAMFHLIPQQKLERIGGRQLNSYCQQFDISSLYATYLNTFRDRWGHSYCAEGRSNRIELRFPKSTTNHNRLVILLDFIKSVEAYVSRATVQRPFVGLTSVNHGLWHDLHEGYMEWMSLSKKYKTVYEVMKNGYPEEATQEVNTSTDQAAPEPSQQLSTNPAILSRRTGLVVPATSVTPTVLSGIQLGELYSADYQQLFNEFLRNSRTSGT